MWWTSAQGRKTVKEQETEERPQGRKEGGFASLGIVQLHVGIGEE